MKLKKRLFSLFPVISTLHQLSLASGKYGIYVFSNLVLESLIFALRELAEAISTLERRVFMGVQGLFASRPLVEGGKDSVRSSSPCF